MNVVASTLQALQPLEIESYSVIGRSAPAQGDQHGITRKARTVARAEPRTEANGISSTEVSHSQAIHIYANSIPIVRIVAFHHQNGGFRKLPHVIGRRSAEYMQVVFVEGFADHMHSVLTVPD